MLADQMNVISYSYGKSFDKVMSFTFAGLASNLTMPFLLLSLRYRLVFISSTRPFKDSQGRMDWKNACQVFSADAVVNAVTCSVHYSIKSFPAP